MTTRPKTALITGITGQDGSYLAEFLLDKGYEVHGIIRRSSSFNTRRIDHLYRDPHETVARFFLHFGDLTDANSLTAVLRETKPAEVYNLAAQSHVRVSFDMPIYTADTVALGTLRLLEALRNHRDESGADIRFFQASSSEMFGNAPHTPLSESAPFIPQSPYGCAKVFAHHATANYRHAYGLHASCGILFNHESPRRGETFVTRKITRAAGRIKLGLQDKLYLGNLDAKRDWGFARDYVEAMWLMLQQDQPDDFIIATGRTISVRDLCNLAFKPLDLNPDDYLEIDPRYFRPNEIDQLEGDFSKARDKLGWQPRTTIEDLVQMMVDFDLALAEKEKALNELGHEIPDASRTTTARP